MDTNHYVPASAPPAPTTSEKRGRLLVVDDEKSIRLLFKMQLESDGYDVTSAADGSEALDILHTARFDLLITDLEMPELNGYTLIRYAQRYWPNLPILICSGSALDRAMPPDVKAAVRDILAKPITPRELSAAVEAVLHSNCA